MLKVTMYEIIGTDMIFNRKSFASRVTYPEFNLCWQFFQVFEILNPNFDYRIWIGSLFEQVLPWISKHVKIKIEVMA